MSKNIEFKGVYYDRQCKYSTNRNNICLVTRLHSNQFKGIPPPPKKNSLDNDFMITKIVSYNHTYKMGDFGLIFLSQIIPRAHGLQKCAFLGVFHKTVYCMILQISQMQDNEYLQKLNHFIRGIFHILEDFQIF